MPIVGEGKYTYDVIDNWGNLPEGWAFGLVSAPAVDSQDRVYVYQRKDPTVLVFDREGNYLNSWGSGSMVSPHGIFIDPDDVVYLTDRGAHVAMKYSLDGQLLQTLGTRDQPSDTGCEIDGGTVLRAAGPFNRPSRMVLSPSGDVFITDGYRNSRVHRFTSGGNLMYSWGSPGTSAPGEFLVPHSLWVDKGGVIYVCDRDNNRVQVFSETGEFMDQWTDTYRPCDIYMDADEMIYVCDLTPEVTVRDKGGNIVARWESAHAHGIYGDSRGDIYVTETGGRKVTKYVKRS